MLSPNRSFDTGAPGVPARRPALALLLATAGWLFLSPFADARAQSRLLDAPRTAGTVGERHDGFAAVHGAAPPEVAALVAQVNQERRALYAERARNDKASIEAVGKIYAAEIAKAAPPKTWFQSQSGQWSQK